MDEKTTIVNKDSEEKLWYAIRVTYNRELKVKEDLDARGIECFVPMQYRREERNGQMVKRLVPSVHNLIFIHIEPSKMVEYKKTTSLPIRYIMNRETHKPITVPKREMDSFITKDGKKLRRGYTTGSCAAAASKAAAIMLLTGRELETVWLMTPRGIGLTLAVASLFPEKTMLVPCLHDECFARVRRINTPRCSGSCPLSEIISIRSRIGPTPQEASMRLRSFTPLCWQRKHGSL